MASLDKEKLSVSDVMTVLRINGTACSSVRIYERKLKCDEFADRRIFAARAGSDLIVSTTSRVLLSMS
jgi:hypothetical protein